MNLQLMLLMLMQVKLAHEQASEHTSASADSHDHSEARDVVDDDGAKSNRRSFTEAPAPPVSNCQPSLLLLLHCVPKKFATVTN